MKAVPIKNCQNCPLLIRTPYPTPDSFERPEYWWCSSPDVPDEPCKFSDDEQTRIILKRMHTHLRLIKGYVEWHEEDKIKIPQFCPLPEVK